MQLKTLVACALVALVFFAALVDPADACGRRRRRRRGSSSRLVITPRNPPLTNPPTPSPTPPPPPPPIPEGWVPPPPRAPAQEMTRTNCEARVEFSVVLDPNAATSAAIDREQIQEQWVYSCKFQVYVEVDIAETNAPTNCACGVTYKRTHPPTDPNYQKAYETKITSFSMVAFDVVRNTVVGVFPAGTFDQLKPNENTTALLSAAASTNSQNYDLTARGYAGLIQNLGKDKFPSSLVPGQRDYTLNNVPAMCFTVEEKYISSYKWPQPPVPLMYTTPNTWVSQCYPYYDFPAGTAKRDVEQGSSDAPKQRYWFKEFLLFPVGADAGISMAGWAPSPRYITAWYRNSNCDVASGVASFDREFASTIVRENVFKLYGAFEWKRDYTSLWVVAGVPSALSNQQQFWSLGYTKVTWKEVYGRNDATGAHREGVLYHALKMVTTPTTPAPYVGYTIDTGLCPALPAAWRTCRGQDNTPGCADLRVNEYNEGAYMYKAPADPMDATFNCAPAVVRCATEKTLLSFQNFGSLARDYSKRKSSVLLTGPRRQFCYDYPTRPVFDSLYFKAYRPGNMQIRKRGVAQAGEVNPRQALPFDHDGNVLPNAPIGPDAPEGQQVLVQPAAGSAKADGSAGGDHPVALFPETYTVPVTLNPADSSFDGAVGSIYDGKQAPCLEGSRGCTCRTNPGRPQCDAPLECGADSFCEPPSCIAGQAGCPCKADGSCGADTLTCGASQKCTFAPSCTPGAAGCTCETDAQCTSEGAICAGDRAELAKTGKVVDGVCLIADASKCTDGASGCACTAAGGCTSASDVCDEVDGVCVSPTCESGQAGCECTSAGRCRSGFTCDKAANRCVQAVCPPGAPGCACLDDGSCSSTGFKCQKFKLDGSDNRCVATGRNCGDQTDRCIRFCGLGRVIKCPACSDQKPQCAGVAQLVPSIAIAALLAMLALFF